MRIGHQKEVLAHTGDLSVSYSRCGQHEQMDIGLTGSRAWCCEQEQQPQCPNPQHLYSIPIHEDNQSYPNLCKLADNLNF